MSLYSIAYILPPIIYLISFQWIKDFFNLKLEDRNNLFFLSIFSSIIGGRIGYVLLYDLSHYLNNPIDIFKIWYGGMSFYGAIVFIALFLFLYARMFKKSFYSLSALFALFSCIGIFIGRIASFLSNQLYGIKYDGIFSVMVLVDGALESRFPSQILEAILEGVILFLIILYLIKTKKSHKKITISFLFFYSIFRIISEFFREPDKHIGYMYYFFTLGMIFSFIALLISVVLITKIRR